MSVRKLLEKDILIRLDEGGFVETERRLGISDKCIVYDTIKSETGDTTGEESLVLVRKSMKRYENRRRGDKIED